MAGNEEFLKGNAKQLVARERELLAMKRKHKRLALWLSFAQSLPALVDPKIDLAELCARVSDRMVAALDLQIVAFFQVDGTRLTPLRQPDDPSARNVIDLGLAVAEFIAGEQTGVCHHAGGPAQGALCEAVGLHRFLWHLMDPAGAPTVLFVAGYDRERAPFFVPFDREDVAHFMNTAHQLALLMGNNNLVRDLERRVDERTHQLADANRDLERVLADLRSKDQRLDADIEEARLFQQKTLAEPPRSPGVDFSTAYLPLEQVGGDLFDVCQRGSQSFRIFLADATGHGVQAAMRTILIKAEYDRIKLGLENPRSVLETLNRRLLALFSDGEIMCTGCCVDVILPGGGSERRGAAVTYANAGGAPLFHWSGGFAREMYGDSPFLGVGEATWPEPLAFRMAPGDLLLAASDGLIEQRNARGEAFEGAIKALAPGAGDSASDFVERVMAAFDAFRGGAPLADDVTLVAMRLPFSDRA